jgi:putative transposase
MYLSRYQHKFKIDVHAWVLMTSHTHLLVTPNPDTALSDFMKAEVF